jgi:hypothetical protein
MHPKHAVKRCMSRGNAAMPTLRQAARSAGRITQRTVRDYGPPGMPKVLTMCARQLSDDELVQLAASACGMSATQYEAIVEIDFVVDPNDPEEFHMLEWSYANRVKLILMTANYGLPN